MNRALKTFENIVKAEYSEEEVVDLIELLGREYNYPSLKKMKDELFNSLKTNHRASCGLCETEKSYQVYRLSDLLPVLKFLNSLTPEMLKNPKNHHKGYYHVNNIISGNNGSDVGISKLVPYDFVEKSSEKAGYYKILTKGVEFLDGGVYAPECIITYNRGNGKIEKVDQSRNTVMLYQIDSDKVIVAKGIKNE